MSSSQSSSNTSPSSAKQTAPSGFHVTTDFKKLEEVYSAAVKNYNEAGALYEKQQFAESVDPLKKACTLFQILQESFLNLEHQAKTPQMKQNFAKKVGDYGDRVLRIHTLLGQACRKCERYLDSMTHFFNSIIYSDMTTFSTKPETRKDSEILEHIENFLISKMKLRKKENKEGSNLITNYTLADVFVQKKKKSSKYEVISYWLPIVEEELAMYPVIEEKYQIPGFFASDQIRLIDTLLNQVLTDEKQYASKRAMLSLEKLRITTAKLNSKRHMISCVETCDKLLTSLEGSECPHAKIISALATATRGLAKANYCLKLGSALYPAVKAESMDLQGVVSVSQKILCWKETAEQKESSLPSLTEYYFQALQDLDDAIRRFDDSLTLSNDFEQYVSAGEDMLASIASLCSHWGWSSLAIKSLATLRQLLKAHSTQDSKVTRIIEIDIDMALDFLRFGNISSSANHLEKASINLEKLKISRSEEEGVLSFLSMYHKAVSGYLLLERGEIAQSLEKLTDILNTLLASPKIKRRIELLALTRYLLAEVQMQHGNAHHANDLAFDALRLRMNLSAMNGSGASTNSVVERLLSPEALNARSCSTVDFVTSSLLQVGQFQKARGSIKDAEHYLKQGLVLSLHSLSFGHVLHYLSIIADLVVRRSLFSLAQYMMTTAIKLWEYLETYSVHSLKDLPMLRAVESYLILGDSLFRQQEYEKSKQNYQEAQALLESFSAYHDKMYLFNPVKKSHHSSDAEGASFQQLRALLHTHQGLLSVAMGDSEQGEKLLQKAASDFKVLPLAQSHIQYLLACHYIQREKNSSNKYALAALQKKFEPAKSVLEDSAAITPSVPFLAKPLLSALGLCVAQEKPDYSSFLTNISMGITMRHQKLSILSSAQKEASTKDVALLQSVFQFDSSSDKLIQELTENMPSSLIACSFSLSNDLSSIIVSRIERNNSPLVVEIPLIHDEETLKMLEELNGVQTLNKTTKKKSELYWQLLQTVRNASETSALHCALSELDNILDASVASTHSTIRTTVKSVQDKKDWWKQRFGLDERIKNLVAYLEGVVLSFWRVILKGSFLYSTPKYHKHVLSAASTIQKQMMKVKTQNNQEAVSERIDPMFVAMLLCALPYLSEAEFSHILCSALGWASNRPSGTQVKVDELSQLFFKAFSCIVTEKPFDIEDLEQHMDKLSVQAKEAKESKPAPAKPVAPTSVVVGMVGQTPIRSRKNRVPLVKKEAEPKPTTESHSSDDSPRSRHSSPSCSITHESVKKLAQTHLPETNNKHVVLVLDKLLQRLPWESMPSLRETSVSRMPSLLFLYAQLRLLEYKSLTVDPKKGYYVLNPSGEFQNTQETFSPWFSKHSWDGLTNKEPSAEDFKKGLENYDVFIYMDHGAGEKYYRSEQIRSVNKCAVSFLMGCSSGALKENGEFEPTGTVLNYILAGCPCVVANLWDVTDMDIDRFSKHLLDNFFSESPNEEKQLLSSSLPGIMAKSRNACKLKYLNGSAPVCYGLPVYCK